MKDHDKDYEVYIARDGEYIAYIGEGKKGRHAHVTSGISHTYELNKHHFLFPNRPLQIEIIPCETKEEAVALEKKLIKSETPMYNTVDNGSDSPRKSLNRYARGTDLFYRTHKGLEIVPLSMLFVGSQDADLRGNGFIRVYREKWVDNLRAKWPGIMPRSKALVCWRRLNQKINVRGVGNHELRNIVKSLKVGEDDWGICYDIEMDWAYLVDKEPQSVLQRICRKDLYRFLNPI